MNVGATVTPVDLLVFGPHPDDIEIGLGGVVARHVDLGFRVGLCDLTAGEMGSNGTVEERLAEAEAARAVLGAAWRVNLRWPDRAIGGAEHVRSASALIREARPRTVAIPYWSDRHPDHVVVEPGADGGRVQRRAAPLRSLVRTMEAAADLLLLHQRLRRSIVCRRRLDRV